MNKKSRTFTLSLSALGIVYGDLGTSPLYALQLVLAKTTPTHDNVLGVLSLVFWSLVLVISTCYVSFFLQADNDGEGGVLALLSLLKRKTKHVPRALFLIGVIGAGLLLGDGMITPAISVISAIEGLSVISPHFSHFIVPSSFVILLALFLSQRFGTGKISSFFGPIIFVWFVVMAILGGLAIADNPTILHAVNPYYAWTFLCHGGRHAYLLLGGIFLVITGAEAMYADLGHFGKNPIRFGWFAVALPSLLLNYFGQGANLLSHPEAVSHLFYSLAPSWFVFPLLVIATMATIIASQAVITASFSLARQAILLEICPRLLIRHTSKNEMGQVYVPQINFILAVGTLLLVLVFQSSNGLAAAFGMAVNLVMIIVAILVIYVAKTIWQWSYTKILFILAPLLMIELIFLGSNLHKIYEGAWIPLLFAFFISTILLTWQKGMQLVRTSVYKKKTPLVQIIKQLDQKKWNQPDDLTMIFITDPYDNSGGGFLNYINLAHQVPKQVLMVSVVIEHTPYVTDKNRFLLKQLADGYCDLTIHYGFMQSTHIPSTLIDGNKMQVFPFQLDIRKATFLVENINISPIKRGYSMLFNWQKKLFRFLLHYSAVDIDFYHLPLSQTISIGSYLTI